MSNRITKEKIIKDYEKLVSLAENLFRKNRYEDSIVVIRTAAFLMYNFNIIYTDEKLENLIHKIANVFIAELPAENYDKTVLFYDWWALETRGLTAIYVKALLENGCRVIVLTREKNRNDIAWLDRLLGSIGVVEFLNTDISYKKQFDVLADIYKKHLPCAAFFHSMPDDVVGCAFFNKIPCKRYLVNLTDHAFWLGATCVDYSVEFRDYGYTISKNYRHIPEEMLLILPYYPVHKNIKANDMNDLFESHQNIVFSGGSLYKIAGSPVFFEIVSYILNTYDDSIFIFIGNGDSQSIKSFIEKKGYQGRFLYFNERPDFEDFMRHSKFYLCTYPIMGALMNQLAVVNKKIPLCYNPNMDDMAHDGDNESLFIDTGHNPVMSYKNLDELKKEIGKLLTDADYLAQKEKQLDGMVISEKYFTEGIKSILENNSTKYKGKDRKVDIDEFSQIYINAENDTNKQYDMLFVRSKLFAVYKCFPIKCFLGCAKCLYRKLKRG